ncbi:type IV pilus modification protein PilV [Marinobacter sp.]|uniref:type IV pilus modification protein PilV n=1 Tax=Marinobacter sp. TaxID=50741 RepID=UPI003569FA4F
MFQVKYQQPQRGFTLIEVLVALLVLLVGLLGVVGMQYLSLQQVNNSNLRSQVNLHALEMVEMIRSNDNSALPAARVDAWEAGLERDIPGAEGEVTFNANTVDVTITWDERQYGSDAAEQTFTMTARLVQ